MELLSKLGIEWRLFIAQIVNFLILLAILRKFLYRPVLHMLNARQDKIEKGLKNAEEMELRMREIEEARMKTILEARREVEHILSESKKEAERIQSNIIEEAKAVAKKIVDEGVVQLDTQKALALKEARTEIAEVVLAATEQVVGEAMGKDIDMRIIEKAIEKIGHA